MRLLRRPPLQRAALHGRLRSSSRSSPCPFFSASVVVSRSVTGMPALTKHMAMPPPIVPAPITPTLVDLARLHVLAGTPGTLAASRSAKKMWRCAFDWSPTISFDDRLRVRVHAPRRPAYRASFRSASIGWPPARAGRASSWKFAATISSNLAGLARTSVSLSSRSCTRAALSRRSTFRAKAIAPSPPDRPRRSRRSGRLGERLLGRHRVARQDHGHRLLHADEARQALRAARARNQAELDFGQAERACRPRRRGSGSPCASSSPPPSGVPCIAAMVGFSPRRASR